MLPDRFRTPATARALTSPSAIVLAGAGAAAAILGGLPLVGAAAVGAACWAGRVAMSLPRRRDGDDIRPGAVRQPWRGFVQDALAAQSRFERTVRRMRPGPLRDRLHDVGTRLHEGVRECWRIACQGDVLEGAYDQLDVQSIEAELKELEREHDGAHGDADHRASVERAIDAVRSQLASAKRISEVAAATTDKLRVIDAQLDEAVARAVELSVQANEVGDFNPLGADVDSLVAELEALRQGLEETGGAARGMAT